MSRKKSVTARRTTNNDLSLTYSVISYYYYPKNQRHQKKICAEKGHPKRFITTRQNFGYVKHIHQTPFAQDQDYFHFLHL